MAPSSPTPEHSNTSASPKFAAFHITDVVYKEVRGVGIPASILVPKDIQPGTHPVMVRWHGGGFCTGHRLFDEWYISSPFPPSLQHQTDELTIRRMGDWILQLALRHAAILVMPDYRLLPEARGTDILADVHSFTTWLSTPGNLSAHLPEPITPDLTTLLVTGESAGGWLALQSARLAPDRVAAVIAHYPMLDLRDAHYTADHEKRLFDPPMPQLDRALLRDFVAGLRGDEVVSSAVPPARGELFASMLQQGSYGRFFGEASELYPLDVLGRGAWVPPPTWILHGEGDTVIPVEGTHRYVEVLRERCPAAAVHVSVREGDHGFDNVPPPAALSDGWVKEGTDFVEKYWPKR